MATLINKQQLQVAAKKVETFLEEQKDWFPVLDLYHAVLELQDQLRGEPMPPGYDFWAKKAVGNCSALSKILFVREARKVILQKIGGGPMPGEADMPDPDPDWLRFWERSISEMSGEELNDAFDSFQDERYYYRKACRRGEMDDAGRRENLRMELWGVAARHINGKRFFQAEKVSEMLEKVQEEKLSGVEVSVPVSVWRDINGTMGGFYRSPEAALQLVVRSAALGLGISLNLRSGQMTCATEMPLYKAQQLFFPRTHELEDEETTDYWVDEHEAPQPNCCPGCRDSQANQLAHMDPGGCLYTEDCD
jgi:hypothetical protein